MRSGDHKPARSRRSPASPSSSPAWKCSARLRPAVQRGGVPNHGNCGVGWRSPSGAVKDRNMARLAESHTPVTWRSPLEATKDHNHQALCRIVHLASLVVALRDGRRSQPRPRQRQGRAARPLAVSLRGDRESQRPGQRYGRTAARDTGGAGFGLSGGDGMLRPPNRSAVVANARRVARQDREGATAARGGPRTGQRRQEDTRRTARAASSSRQTRRRLPGPDSLRTGGAPDRATTPGAPARSRGCRG
jgi:hypothetical protein